jgi:hypothetical protein
LAIPIQDQTHEDSHAALFNIDPSTIHTHPVSTLFSTSSIAAAGIEAFNCAVLTLEKLLKSIFFVTMFAQKLLLPALAVITSVAGKSSSNFSLPQE